MNIRIAIFVGGENLQQQFKALKFDPDIIIATPGRLIYILHKTNINLKKVEILVYDEADRLFELGFASQIRTLQKFFSINKQVMIFSATLPKCLTIFTSEIMKHPTVIRLDINVKISRNLDVIYYF